MPRSLEIFLDVETDFHHNLTVIGFSSSQSGLVQLVGSQITRTRLRRELPHSGRLFTYNGHAFDLSCIRKQLGLDLRDCFESVDLRWTCQTRGLKGGQKKIEARLGFARRLDGLDGLDAIRLWHAHRHGDDTALETLLAYNAEDLAGMRHIKRVLSQRGWI